MNVVLDAKVLIEGMDPPYRVLGDSGYPISKCLITPYSTDEAEGLFVFFYYYMCLLLTHSVAYSKETLRNYRRSLVHFYMISIL